MNAIALNSSMFNGARACWLLRKYWWRPLEKAGGVFFINAVIAVITVLLLMKIVPREIGTTDSDD